MCPTIFFMNALFNSRLSVLSPSIFTFLREGCTRVPCPRGATWRRAAKWVRVWCGVVFCIILFNILLNYLVYHYISLYCIALLCTALCCIVYHYVILHGRMHSISFSCLIVRIIVQHSKCTVLTQYGQRKIFLHVLSSVLSWVCVSQSSAVGYRQSHLMGCQVLWRSTAIKNNQMYTKSDRTLYVCIICLCSQFHKRFNFNFHLHFHFHFHFHSYFSSFLHYLIICILILISNLIFNYMSSI